MLINKLQDLTTVIPGARLEQAPKQKYDTVLLYFPDNFFLHQAGDLYLAIDYEPDKGVYTVTDDHSVTDALSDADAPADLYDQVLKNLAETAEFNNVEPDIESVDDLQAEFDDETKNLADVKIIVANFYDFYRDIKHKSVTGRMAQ